MYFFHQQLAEAVQQRYLASEEEKRNEQRRLAAYFQYKADPVGNGTWTGNYPRGLSELPHHQARGQMLSELKKTLTDFRFLEAKVVALGPQPLLEDYAQVNDEDLSLIHSFLQREAHILASEPRMLISHLHNVLYLFKGESGPARSLLLNARAALADRPWLRLTNRPPIREASSALLRALNHGAAINTLAWSPDGAMLASAGDDGIIRLWDLATGILRNLLKGHIGWVRLLAWSPDGRTLASASGPATLLNYGSGDNAIRLWDPNSGSCTILEGHTDPVRALAWSRDGSILASASGAFTDVSSYIGLKRQGDNTVRL